MHIDRVPLAKGRWDGHRPQIETGFLKRRRMRLCLLTARSIAAAPAWRVKDTLGTGGVGRAVLPTHARRRYQSKHGAGQPFSKLSRNANFITGVVWKKIFFLKCIQGSELLLIASHSTFKVSPVFSLLHRLSLLFSLAIKKLMNN